MSQQIEETSKNLGQLSSKEREIYDAEQILVLYNMRLHFAQKQFFSGNIVKVQSNYYDLSLEERKQILQAPSINHLCKSIVMENTVDNGEYVSIYYPKYILVVIQYTTKLNTEKLQKAIRDYHNEHSLKQLGKKSFHYRLVDDKLSEELTGYGYNAVTPFLSRTNIPIILSQGIAKLTPEMFWLGGGGVDLKIRISIDEFIHKCGFNVNIFDILYDE